uniref:Ava_C0101 and related proteins n=1 Tax=uncultured organism TaxID=155900 RepID=A0A7L9QBM4_9ZZZZ|nr:hypothetical protein [uncultured organism]
MRRIVRRMSDDAEWPALPYSAWRPTCETLHLWTQIVGKIRLELTPWLNHSWHVPLYVTARGLSTSVIPYEGEDFEIRFDFIDHVLDIETSSGGRGRIRLAPQPVCDFYAAVMKALGDLGIVVQITGLPCEIPGAIPFSADREHASYDADAAHRFWRALLQADRVFKKFRTGFIGKASPVHFFWGSFDLAVTRFSGRTAPPFTGKVPGLSTAVMVEAYSHEVSSAGFWPGGGGIDYASFYSYAYPAPDGFKDAAVSPQGAFFSEALGEFLLPYEEVRNARDPEASLLSFLQSTYEAAAETAHWDRARLEKDF